MLASTLASSPEAPAEVRKELEQPKAKTETRKELAQDALNFLGKAQKEAVQAIIGAPAGNEWELLETVMDSGANVSVSPPNVGVRAGYEVQESAASRAGVSYVAANGGEIPNLGERFLAVVTEEGTVRGLEQQVADVTKSLEAIRANVRSGHAVIFDDDGTGRGLGSFMINKSTGETNVIRDDGSNYVMRRWIIPAQEVNAVLQAYHDGADPRGFARQAS